MHQKQCSRIRILRFFQISKKHDFLRFFWNDVSKKRKKSYKKYQVCWMFIEILASKLPDVMGTYRHLSHTVLSCIVYCVHTSEQDVWCWWPWLLPVPTSGSWVIKGCMTIVVTFLTFFLKIQKNMSFYIFWDVAHVFSNTGQNDTARIQPILGHGDKTLGANRGPIHCVSKKGPRHYRL